MKNKLIAGLLATLVCLTPLEGVAQTNTVIWTQVGTSASGAAEYAPVSVANPIPTTGGGGGGGTISPATKVSTAALAANLVVDAASGHLTSFEVAADSTLSGAAWWVMIYDATTAPADGSITPAKCYAIPSGATTISAAFPIPTTFTTGIVIGVSTTGCFTKTASTHAFISGDFQ